MNEMLNAIIKFEQETNFQIQPHIQAKKGFNIIKGFHQAFLNYKIEISRVENIYTNFFNGIGYNKIEPEYLRVLWNVGWFLEIIIGMEKHFQSVMTPQDKTDYSNFKLDILDTQIAYNNFIINNKQNFDLYNGYFIRLQGEFDFNDECYITFKEYQDNYAEIEKLEYESYKQWVNAQRISGKLGDR